MMDGWSLGRGPEGRGDGLNVPGDYHAKGDLRVGCARMPWASLFVPEDHELSCFLLVQGLMLGRTGELWGVLLADGRTHTGGA